MSVSLPFFFFPLKFVHDWKLYEILIVEVKTGAKVSRNVEWNIGRWNIVVVSFFSSSCGIRDGVWKASSICNWSREYKRCNPLPKNAWFSWILSKSFVNAPLPFCQAHIYILYIYIWSISNRIFTLYRDLYFLFLI